MRAIIVKPKRKSSGNNKQSSTTTARKKRKTAAPQKQPSTSTSTSTASSTRTAKRSEVTPTNNGGASDTTSKRTTRNSTGLTRSSAESLDENSDGGSVEKEKGKDKQQPPTTPTATAKDKEGDENDSAALNKGDTTLDTDMEKEEEKDDASLELESDGTTHDENMFDDQSPVRGGGSSMQSPAKSVSSSDGANYNTIVLTTLAPFAKEMQRKADEIGEEITELYEQRIVTPLEQQITTIKRRIEKRENILENNEKNKDTEDLEDCYKLNIAECKLDLEGKRKELAEKELELESIRGGGNIQQAVLAKCTSAAQAQLTVQDVSGISLLAPSTDSDNNATTGSMSNIDTQMVDIITTQLMPEVTNRCKSFINARMPGLIKKLDATKSKALKEMKSLFYDKSVLPLKEKRDRLTYAYNIKVDAFNSIVDGVKDYPGSEEEYWEMVSEERALLDKKTDELKKEVDEARSIYHTAKEIWIDEVKKQDEVFKKTFTIMIGSVKIEPSRDDEEDADDTEK